MNIQEIATAKEMIACFNPLKHDATAVLQTYEG
jgi:hypothetical protein